MEQVTITRNQNFMQEQDADRKCTLPTEPTLQELFL